MSYEPSRLNLLVRLYEIYAATMNQDQARHPPWYCKKGCASCCTCNVTLTALEMAYLWDGLSLDQKGALRSSVVDFGASVRYRPQTTINGLAALCMADEALPEEKNDPAWGRCPLLTKEGTCPIYDRRPFGCRALLSEINCADAGYARIPPLTLTLNNLFMQYIEHLDGHGVTGNFTDMIHCAVSVENEKGNAPQGSAFLIPNRSIPALMVPPEHAKSIRPVLQRIAAAWKGKVGDGTA